MAWFLRAILDLELVPSRSYVHGVMVSNMLAVATVLAVLSARRVAVGAVDGTAPAAAVVDPEGNVITFAA